MPLRWSLGWGESRTIMQNMPSKLVLVEGGALNCPKKFLDWCIKIISITMTGLLTVEVLKCKLVGWKNARLYTPNLKSGGIYIYSEEDLKRNTIKL